MSKYPTKFEVGSAADLLGLSVFDLERAFRALALVELDRQRGVVRQAIERPNMGRFQRLVAVADVAQQAWDEEADITEGLEAETVGA